MKEKAEFAVKTLREYAKQQGFSTRNTSDLSTLEEWLIIELLRVEKLSIQRELLVASELKEAERIISTLQAYSQIHPITGVRYPEGTHQEMIKRAQEWGWRFRNGG